MPHGSSMICLLACSARSSDVEGALMPPPSVFGAHAESQTVPVSNLEHLLGVSQPDQAPMLQSGFSSALAPGQSNNSVMRSGAPGDRAAGQLDGAGEASIGSVSWLSDCKGCQDCTRLHSHVRGLKGTLWCHMHVIRSLCDSEVQVLSGCKPVTSCHTGRQAEQQQCLWGKGQVGEVWR